MQKSMFWKGLVVAVIVLFFGASVVPSMSGNVNETNENNEFINHPKQEIFLEYPPEEEWNKSFGGIENETGYSVQQTSDGGYIIAGVTSSFGAGSDDVWLIKTDSSGNELWNKTFGGTDDDVGWSVQQTSDGGYIIAGVTSSFGAGSDDVWLIKTDSSGNELWNKTFGVICNDAGYSVQQTSDGGYIITGCWYDSLCLWLIKTDSFGNETWNKQIGFAYKTLGFIAGKSVQQTSDGGYIITGWRGLDDFEVILIKTDSFGNETWRKIFQIGNWDLGYSVQQTSDGGYIITAGTGTGSENIWLIKTDSSGNELWNKTFGENILTAHSGCYGVQTSDGGYIITGMKFIITGMKDGYWLVKAWLIKTDNNGNELWNKTFGGTYSHGFSVQQTSDGGYIVAGITYSSNMDVLLIKVAPENGENQPPFADFTWTPTNPEPGEMITFDASDSYDPDGYITLYEWDWDNDGVYDESSTNPTTTHSWSNSGSYPVTLRVTDNESATDTETKTVYVGDVNLPPNTPDTPSGPTTRKVKQFGLYSTKTTDPDSILVQYRFDWDAEDSHDYSEWTRFYLQGRPIFILNSWTNPGTYVVKAQARDYEGATSQWSNGLTVIVGGENQPPVADFTWMPLNPVPDELTRFDASDSYDPDGKIVSYEWDFDNDGQFDDGTGINSLYYWSEEGVYFVSLKVTDDDGKTDTITKTVTVREPPTITSLIIKGGKVFRGSLKDIVFRRGMEKPTFWVTLDRPLASSEAILIIITSPKGVAWGLIAERFFGTTYRAVWDWKSILWKKTPDDIYVGGYTACAHITRVNGCSISKSEDKEFYVIFDYNRGDCFVETSRCYFPQYPSFYGGFYKTIYPQDPALFIEFINRIEGYKDRRNCAFEILNSINHHPKKTSSWVCFDYAAGMIEWCRAVGIPARGILLAGIKNDAWNKQPKCNYWKTHGVIEIKAEDGKWYHFDPTGDSGGENGDLGCQYYAKKGYEFRPHSSGQSYHHSGVGITFHGFYACGATKISNSRVSSCSNYYKRYSYCADVTDISFQYNDYDYGDSCTYWTTIANRGEIPIDKPVYLKAVNVDMYNLGPWTFTNICDYMLTTSMQPSESMMVSNTFTLPYFGIWNWLHEYFGTNVNIVSLYYYDNSGQKTHTSVIVEEIPGLCFTPNQMICVDGECRPLDNATYSSYDYDDDKYLQEKGYSFDIPAFVKTYYEREFDEAYSKAVVSIENPDSTEHSYSYSTQLVGKGDTVYVPSLGNISSDVTGLDVMVDHFIVFSESEGTDGNVSIHKFSMDATIHDIEFLEYAGNSGAIVNVSWNMVLDSESLQEIVVYCSLRDGGGLNLGEININYGEEIVDNGDTLVQMKIVQLDPTRLGDDIPLTVSLFNNGETNENMMVTVNVSKITGFINSTSSVITVLYNEMQSVSVPPKESINADFIVPVPLDTESGLWDIFVENDKGGKAESSALIEDAFEITCTQNISVGEDEEFVFDATVRNTWDTIVHGVEITLDLFEWFNTTDPLEVFIGNLQPGEEVTISWDLTTRFSGVFPLVVSVNSTDGGSDQANASVISLAPVDLRISADVVNILPPQGYVDVPINFTVSNNGDLNSTNVFIQLMLPENVSATPMEWTVDSLSGGEEIVFDSVLRFDITEGFFVDVYAADGDGNNATGFIQVHIRETTPPAVEITKPEKGLYLNNNRIIPLLFNTVIFGDITIQIDGLDYESGINRVDFYIDNELKNTSFIAPFNWTWEENAFFRHNIKVIAYDNDENNATFDMSVWKFF